MIEIRNSAPHRESDSGSIHLTPIQHSAIDGSCSRSHWLHYSLSRSQDDRVIPIQTRVMSVVVCVGVGVGVGVDVQWVDGTMTI